VVDLDLLGGVDVGISVLGRTLDRGWGDDARVYMARWDRVAF
jgi:hypothetical protein